MLALIDGVSNLLPFGSGFVLILAALAFVAFIAFVVPIALGMRRHQVVRSSSMAEMKGRADVLLDDDGRAARRRGGFEARTERAIASRNEMITFFKALLDR